MSQFQSQVHGAHRHQAPHHLSLAEPDAVRTNCCADCLTMVVHVAKVQTAIISPRCIRVWGNTTQWWLCRAALTPLRQPGAQPGVLFVLHLVADWGKGHIDGQLQAVILPEAAPGVAQLLRLLLHPIQLDNEHIHWDGLCRSADGQRQVPHGIVGSLHRAALLLQKHDASCAQGWALPLC